MREQVSSGVADICASAAAFPALKKDGSVVTWGHRDYGGDSRTVRDELKSGAFLLETFSFSSVFPLQKLQEAWLMTPTRKVPSKRLWAPTLHPQRMTV